MHDTCGILNLHGIPGVVGAIWGIIASRISQNMGDSAELLEMVYMKAGEADWT